MLRRKMMETLVGWKEKKDRECLLVRGARQIGKTYIIERFGRERYEHFVEINFEQEPELRAAFGGNLDVGELIKQISLRKPDAHFVEGRTLVFFDEIQACPQARTSLKFWALDGRFDVVASGSLLGINYRAVSSFPVGYERQVAMHSLDFEEFLWALGVSAEILAELKEKFGAENPGDFAIDPYINEVMLKYLREYMAVGGMPAVVNRYLRTGNFNDVHGEQQKILDAYLNDIAKYAGTADRPKARSCFLSIPRQLAKENTKFQYGLVEARGTARKFANSLDWLRDANLVTFCTNVSTPEFPLASYEKPEQFRIYMNDIGLLVAMFGYEMKAAVVADTLKGSAKGGVYENLIADCLLKKNLPLRYYRREDSSMEVEFLLEREASVVPIEVKSKRGETQSLNTLLKHDDIKKGYKFTAGNAGIDGKKVTLPFYMAMWL